MTAPSRPLTLATLREARACTAQMALFRRLFGTSVDVTEALCAEHAETFNWVWAAEHLLGAPAWAAYEAATASAWAAYQAATASAWASAYITDAN